MVLEFIRTAAPGDLVALAYQSSPYNMSTVDAVNVLRGGAVDEAEWETAPGATAYGRRG